PPPDQAPAGAPAPRAGAADLRPHGPTADDPPRGGGGMSTLRAEPGWADVLVDCAADHGTADRLIRQLNAAPVAALGFCRLRGRPWPGRPPDPPAERGPRGSACLLPPAGALGPRRRRSVDRGRATGGA